MRQRPHLPHELGPRVYRSGRWFHIDLRPWGLGRPTMRNPKDVGWPASGRRTESRKVANAWRRLYWDFVKTEHEREMLGDAKPTKLVEAIEEYLKHRKATVALETLRNDRQAMRQLQKDFRGSVHEINPQKTINRLLTEGRAPNTVATHAAFLSSFFRWLGKPYKVTLPKTQRADVKVWDTSEIKKIREAAKTEGALVAIDLGLFIGLRQGEIFGAEWSDIEAARWTMRVRRQGDGRSLKGRRARTAVILPGWSHAAREGRIALQMSYTAQGRLFMAILKRAGLYVRGVRWHSLRHTYARMFLEAKPDLRLLQASLGHASVTTTERYYDWLLPDRAAELARIAIHGS